MVSIDELHALEARLGDGFRLVTHAELQAAIDADRAAREAALARVQQDLANDPRLPLYTTTSTTLPAYAIRHADGTLEIRVGSSTNTVIINGVEDTIASVAGSLQRTPERSNQEAIYASLIEVLPEDEAADLPAASGLSDAELKAAVARAAERVERAVPNEAPEASAGDLGCPAGTGLSAAISWSLRGDEPPIRDQQRRGTCAAFAITGGIETLIHRTRGLMLDLSEQELYGNAKAFWGPSADGYGDGLNIGRTVEAMVLRSFRQDAEPRWSYNGSKHRVDLEEQRKYEDSCTGYGEICSDTNHQLEVYCAASTPGPSGVIFCAYTEPASVEGMNYGDARLGSTLALWSITTPDAAMGLLKAELNAGHPIAIGALLDTAFTTALDDDPEWGLGVVRPRPAGYTIELGLHAMLLVGYVLNGQLPEGVPPGEGGGYFVARNSWGCSGDRGHLYLAFDWVKLRVTEAYAITGVTTSAVRPTLSLKTNRSSITTAGSARLTMKANRAVVKVRLFEGLSSTVPIFEETTGAPADGKTFTFDRAFTAADNGVRLFFARGEDATGNVVTTNTIGVLVNIDEVAPTITLSASSSTVTAPGLVTLSAQAADMGGIDRVRFYYGLSLIGEDRSAPYSIAHALDRTQIGDRGFFAIAIDRAGNQRISNVVTVHVTDVAAPIIHRFSATPAHLTSGGPVTLSWDIEGAPTSLLLGPGATEVVGQTSVTLNVASTTVFTLLARNSGGFANASVTVGVGTDPNPPTVTLVPSVNPVILGLGPLTLTAEVMDDVGVGSVDLYRDGMLVDVDLTPANGFVFYPSFGHSQVGDHTFRAVARDLSGNTADSPDVVITVRTPIPVYVSPSGTDNPSCSAASPCLTIEHAASLPSTERYIELADGTYDSTNQGTGSIDIPPGYTVAAAHVGMAAVKSQIHFLGNGTLDGVRIDRTAPNGDQAGVLVDAGAVSLNDVDFRGRFGSAGVKATRTGRIVMNVTASRGAVNYTALTTANNNNATEPFLVAQDQSDVLVLGGNFDGPGLGDASTPTSPNADGAAMLVRDQAHLTLSGVHLVFRGVGIGVLGGGNLDLQLTTLQASGSSGLGNGIHLQRLLLTSNPSVRLTQSRINGQGTGANLAHGIWVNESQTTTSIASVRLINSTIEACRFGVANNFGGTLRVVSDPHLGGSTIRDNLYGGIHCDGPCDLDLDGDTISGNGAATDAGATHTGGIWLGTANKQARLKLRRVHITQNGSMTSNSATNIEQNSGMYLKGDATSVFDLGLGSDPGQNVFTGNTSGAMTSNVTVGVNTAVVVHASGNTWDVSTQGADAAGSYAFGRAPCGAMSCEQSMGSGPNYRMLAGSGGLRLVE